MRILYIGQLGEGQTCLMRMEALSELGHEILPLNVHVHLDSGSRLAKHLQKRMAIGPSIRRLNKAIIEIANARRPEMLWADKQEYLHPSTLQTLRQLNVRTVHFTPDPYFTLGWKRTRLMDACMPLWDCVITSKRYELDEYRRICRRVLFMPLGFSETVHRPALPSDIETSRRFSSDVSFVGGWEPRRERLLATIAATGCEVKIWGYAWDHLVDGHWSIRRACRLRRNAGRHSFRITKNEFIARALKGGEVYGDQYAWALSCSKISLGLLRMVCPDQHTTRSFEIPACRTMMIADRTDEHREFFTEGKEAEFFSSKDELIDKINYYLQNGRDRGRIAEAGYKRCLESGYSYRYRLSRVLAELG